MTKRDGQEVGFQDGGLFFSILKMRTNQQPDIYNIPKPHRNPYPEPSLNLGML